MTPEAQRIAIAEACKTIGTWYCPTCRETVPAIGVTYEECHDTRIGGCGGDLHQDTPDYLNDLNAMHEAEKVLTCEQTRDYLYELERVTRGHASAFMSVNQAMQVALLVHATAAQRAEAFLKTKGLWVALTSPV